MEKTGKKRRIVVLDGYTLNPGDLSWSALESMGDCVVYERTSPSQVVERCRDAEVVLTNKVPVMAAEIEQLPHLEYIGVLATGYNVVDLQAAAHRGIVVTNIPAYSTASVVQMVFAHLLNVTNAVQRHSDSVRKGDWTRCADFSYTLSRQTELEGKTMGIVGLGHIGSRVASVAHAMGMNVVATTSKSREELPSYVVPLAWDDFLAASDVLSLHCPLTANTRHLIDAEAISKMKDGAILINTGRGPLLDEQAVADALESGKLAAACVDVLSTEPPAADNPLLSAPNCYITPHIAWATYEARVRLMQIAVANLESYFAGSPVNRVG